MLPSALVLTLSVALPPGDGPVDFTKSVRPILSDRCFQCHGPDAGSVAADLRLDRRESAIDDFSGFPAIVPGDAEASELIKRATHGKDSQRMPPPESHLRLTADEIDLLRRWIDEGAPYEAHWSFAPPRSTAPPAVENEAWIRDPLDRFVLAGLEAAGLEPAPEADMATLLRRVTLDLTGLPPEPERVAEVVGDPTLFEAEVDRLLASWAHAEHMTRGWLDVSRYADTFGYQADKDMKVWPWRDWVLRAFHSNLPYDQFVIQQLAGDLMPEATQETRLATTFNRLHRQTNEGGSVEEEFRVESVADRVETMSGAFLGLTVGCARCHDHKFDPVSQADYFGLFAFFDDIDESGLYSHFTDAVPTPALDLPTEEQRRELAALEQAVSEAEASWPESAVEDALDPGALFYESFDGPPKPVAELRYRLIGDPGQVQRGSGQGVQLSGENAIEFPDEGSFHRSDPFSVGLRLRAPEAFERAVVLHRTKSWTDSGSRGYQLLIEDGHPTVSLVHFWPGDAIAIRALAPLAVGEWTHLGFTYDGSSRASGLRLYVDGERAETEVVRDRLTRTIRGGSIGHLAIGSRFRDKGFRGGEVDDLFVYSGELGPGAMAQAAETGSPAGVGGANDVSASEHRERLRAARRARDDCRDRIRQIMTMRQSPDLPAAQHQARLLHRGEYSSPGDVVEPATPASLPLLGVVDPGTRLDLARWLTHPDHPLTARVQVDRLWRTAFQKGLVSTPEDFGSQCEAPEHQELLDTLATELVASGWDSRAMLKRLVLSATYRQSSTSGAASRKVDPDGRLLSRAASGRRTAEVIRDSVFAAAGLLTEQHGGPPVFPYQPLGLWQEKRDVVYPMGSGDDLFRRSLYTFWRRTSPPPTMSLFDAPSREVCTVARPVTSTPLQVLVMWNDPQFVAAAVALGKRAVEGASTEEGRVELLFAWLMSREPTELERSAVAELIGMQRGVFESSPADAASLARYVIPVPGAADSEADAVAAPTAAEIEHAATAVAASTLLTLDEVLYRR